MPKRARTCGDTRVQNSKCQSPGESAGVGGAHSKLHAQLGVGSDVVSWDWGCLVHEGFAGIRGGGGVVGCGGTILDLD